MIHIGTYIYTTYIICSIHISSLSCLAYCSAHTCGISKWDTLDSCISVSSYTYDTYRYLYIYYIYHMQSTYKYLVVLGPLQCTYLRKPHVGSYISYISLYKLVNKRSNTELGNTQSAPRGGEEERLCAIYLYHLTHTIYIICSLYISLLSCLAHCSAHTCGISKWDILDSSISV